MQERTGGGAYQRWGKRALDIVLGSVLAVLAIPLILVLSVGSAFAFRAWPVFVQKRVGRHERPFWFLKIRSLPKHTPRAADKHELAQFRPNFYGSFLRRTHFDELPQLLLVPTGRMSLVGPRPEMPELLNRYNAEAKAARSSILPGCTGLWQLSDVAGRQIYDAPQYDEYYVRNVSFGLDARILVDTLRAMFGRRARYRSPVNVIRVPSAHDRARLSHMHSPIDRDARKEEVAWNVTPRSS